MNNEIDETSRLLGNIEAQLIALNGQVKQQREQIKELTSAFNNHRVKTAGLSATVTMITLFSIAAIKKFLTGEY